MSNRFYNAYSSMNSGAQATAAFAPARIGLEMDAVVLLAVSIFLVVRILLWKPMTEFVKKRSRGIHRDCFL